jgi:glycosyltransferase involved in cell wall biosynthesis
MQNYRVSVLISSYNQSHYLREAIDSVIQQTKRPHEIIIADDHSTKDDSVDLIRRYESRFPGWVRGVLQKKNVGIPANRNAGLNVVTGDYLTVLDGDDRLLPNFLEKLTGALAANPEAQCAYANRYEITPDGERISLRETQVAPSGDLFAHVAERRLGILRTLVAPFALIKDAGLFDPNFYHHDGYILTLRLARVAKFVYVPEPLMEKRTHGGGTSKTISLNERIACCEAIADEVARLASHLRTAEQHRLEKFWLNRVAQLRRSRS